MVLILVPDTSLSCRLDSFLPESFMVFQVVPLNNTISLSTELAGQVTSPSPLHQPPPQSSQSITTKESDPH